MQALRSAAITVAASSRSLSDLRRIHYHSIFLVTYITDTPCKLPYNVFATIMIRGGSL